MRGINTANPDEDLLRRLHDEYCRATGLPIRYTFEHYSDWYLFAQRFEPGDIAAVVAYLRKLYRSRPDILRASLRFSKLIKDRQRFEEYLAEARAERRKPVKTDRDRVLEASGREAQRESEARSVGQILSRILSQSHES